MDIEKVQQSSTIFECIPCSYNTVRKSQYQRHCCTNKHKNVTKSTIISSESSNPLRCDNCNKIYNSRMGLWRHKNNCKIIKVPTVNNIENFKNSISDSLSVFEIIKQNNEFKELLVQQSKYIHEQYKEQFEKIQEQHKEQIVQIQEQNKEQFLLINKFIEREPTQIINTTNNSTTNQSFNLNVFLNETCKDAMNVKEFLDNLNPTIDDLENVGEKGFVKGISEIILKSLRGMEVNKRPIHCTDIKREIVYLKEDDKWNKDDTNNSKMKELIRRVENKNFSNIYHWQQMNPNVRVLDSPEYNKQVLLMDKSGEAINNEDRVRGKVLKELLKEIHVNGK